MFLYTDKPLARHIGHIGTSAQGSGPLTLRAQVRKNCTLQRHQKGQQKTVNRATYRQGTLGCQFIWKERKAGIGAQITAKFIGSMWAQTVMQIFKENSWHLLWNKNFIYPLTAKYSHANKIDKKHGYCQLVLPRWHCPLQLSYSTISI